MKLSMYDSEKSKLKDGIPILFEQFCFNMPGSLYYQALEAKDQFPEQKQLMDFCFRDVESFKKAIKNLMPELNSRDIVFGHNDI